MSARSHPRFDVTTLHPADIRPLRLWTGLLLAPAAWIAQGGLGWYVGSLPCETALATTARVTLTAISLATLAVAGVGLSIAWTNWGRTSAERDVADIKGWDRLEFMSATGVLTSGMFVIAIMWAGLTTVFLQGCGSTR